MAIAKSTTMQERPTDGRPKPMPGLRVVDIHSRNSRECEQVLSELLALAKAGRLTGLNWSAALHDRKVIAGRAGVMTRDGELALFSAFRKAVSIVVRTEK